MNLSCDDYCKKQYSKYQKHGKSFWEVGLVSYCIQCLTLRSAKYPKLQSSDGGRNQSLSEHMITIFTKRKLFNKAQLYRNDPWLGYLGPSDWADPLGWVDSMDWPASLHPTQTLDGRMWASMRPSLFWNLELGSSGIISSSYFRGYSSRTPLTCTSPPSQQIHRKSYEFPRILSILMKVIQNAPFQHEYAINLHFHRSKNIFSSIHLFLSWIMTHASQFLKF